MFPPPRKWLPPTNAYKGVFSVQHARPSTGSQAPSPRCDCVKRSTACSFSHFWFSGRERGLPIHTISTILILSSVPEWRYSSNLFLDWVTSRENSVSLLSLPPYHLFFASTKINIFFLFGKVLRVRAGGNWQVQNPTHTHQPIWSLTSFSFFSIS